MFSGDGGKRGLSWSDQLDLGRRRSRSPEGGGPRAGRGRTHDETVASRKMNEVAVDVDLRERGRPKGEGHLGAGSGRQSDPAKFDEGREGRLRPVPGRQDVDLH